MLKFANTIEEMPNAFDKRELRKEELAKFYYDGTMLVRTGEEGDSPIDDIMDTCREASGNNKFLLMGHRGSGKSTELNEMSVRLQNEGYQVYTIQCMVEMDLNRALYSDLLILLGDALMNIANRIQCRLDDSLLKELVRFWEEREETETENEAYSAGAEFGVNLETPSILSGVIKLFATLKGGVQFSEENHVSYKKRFDQRISVWVSILNRISDEITKKLDGKQPIIIFEDLDKLNEKDTYNVFYEKTKALCDFSFPIIYTFPIALSYHAEFGDIEDSFQTLVFPMIKLESSNGERYEEGYHSIHEIIKKRTKEDLFEEGVENYLIEKTGGSLRDLFTAIMSSSRIAGRRNKQQIGMEEAEIALRKIKSVRTKLFDENDYHFLANIYLRKEKGKKTIEDTEKLKKMLLGGVVLEYNGERWCNLHPLVTDYLIELGIIPNKTEQDKKLAAIEGSPSEK